MTDEAVVRRMLAVDDRAQVLKVAIDTAWQAYLSAGVAREPTARAAVLWDDINRNLRQGFALLPGVTQHQSANTIKKVYVIDNMVCLQPKKHDSMGWTQTYPTRAHKNAIATGTLGDGEFDHIDALTFGYQLDAAESSIAGYPVVRTVAGRIEWLFDLRDIVGGAGVADLRPLNPVLPVTLPSLPAIVSRRFENNGERE